MSVLLGQPEIFERILSLLVQGDPLDCSVADCPHTGAKRGNQLDPATPLHVLGQGHHYEITGLDEFLGLHPNGFPGLAEVLPDSPSLIKSEDAAPRTDCPREVHLEARSRVFDRASQSPRLYASMLALTISTFSCDIAYSERPTASRASAFDW